MRIESLIRRKSGTRITLGSETYHFNATAQDPRHTAEVTNEDHIQTFLAIKGGYAIAKGKDATVKAAPQPPASNESAQAGTDSGDRGSHEHGDANVQNTDGVTMQPPASKSAPTPYPLQGRVRGGK